MDTGRRWFTLDRATEIPLEFDVSASLQLRIDEELLLCANSSRVPKCYVFHRILTI